MKIELNLTKAELGDFTTYLDQQLDENNAYFKQYDHVVGKVITQLLKVEQK